MIEVVEPMGSEINLYLSALKLIPDGTDTYRYQTLKYRSTMCLM